MRANAPMASTPAAQGAALRRHGADAGGGAHEGGEGCPVFAVLVIFCAGVAVLLAGVGGGLANILYVVLAAGAGFALHARSPAAYVSFTLWLWFVTPFVRRVLDMHHGWAPTSPTLLAPLAVALISMATLLGRGRELRGILYAPFLLVFMALVYGYAVGLITTGVIPATYALATWVAPVLLGLYVAIHWRRYPEFARAVRATFIVALPILAAYGIYQFVKLPRWDAQWMTNADLRSIGDPRPFAARVFSTLNTPGPFGAFLCAGSLMLLGTRSRLRFVGIALAVVSLLLTRTRAAWGAFVIGLIVQRMGQPLRNLPRYAATLVAVAIVAIPIARTPSFSALILPRIKTLTNLSRDNSFTNRYNFSLSAAATIAETAEGGGLGATGGAVKLRGGEGVRSLDNGFLEVFYVFGWPGGTLFFLGLFLLVLQSARFRETRVDPFANAARATAVALIAMLPIGDVFTGSTGTLIWVCGGLGIAGHAYHLTTGQALRSARARAALDAATAVAPRPLVAADAGAGALAVAGAGTGKG
ncbi:MAG: hypothetical protein IT356_03140 [Gemmatimonadaceae bacterium]|nr:hypothetical protein [Gemmatimonadaceae bacterium]